jgi:hypothetical protein
MSALTRHDNRRPPRGPERLALPRSPRPGTRAGATSRFVDWMGAKLDNSPIDRQAP